MKLPSFHPVVLIVGVSLLLPSSVSAHATLTQRDKSQIIRFILRTYDFRDSDTWRGNHENTIYLLDENISPSDVPSRHGLKFKLVNQAQIDQLRLTGVEYYRVNEFDVRRTSVRTYFIRTFVSIREANDGAMEYICRKVRGRWKLKARLAGGGAS